jgi:hypothetical protein
MRRALVALGIGTAIAGALATFTYMTIMRGISNGQEVIPIIAAYPKLLLYLDLPGIWLLLIVQWTTEIQWGLHPTLSRVLVTAGDGVFCSIAAYVMAGFLERLSARWKQR